MLSRIKFDIEELFTEMLDQLPSEVFESSETTFVDVEAAGGQSYAAIKKRLLKAGHTEENIKKRVTMFFNNSFEQNFAINKNSVDCNTEVRDILMNPSAKKFDVCLMNPPYSQGAKLLYRYFFEEGLELADTVLSVMPLNLHSKFDSLKQVNYLIKKHNTFISENISDYFNVGLNNIHYVIASKDVENDVEDLVDLLEGYNEIYPERQRLNPVLGNTPAGLKKHYDEQGKDVLIKVFQTGPVFQKVNSKIVDNATQKVNCDYMVFHNNAPSMGKFNVYLGENLSSEITWSQHVFAYKCQNKIEADKLVKWLESDLITTEVKKMLDMKKKHTISLEMLRKLPWYE